ncbi:VWA containing CoxE family protein [Scytonema sp. HK-05]|uniref:hypothetical protein n=1 Tax=Scytonema sp. HK-05 TaxID=1137095 RepID=UPI0009FA0524|nr:hypothetical protein [Scytonema sp. HK-05]BAY43398.1 VWA containing CoxE family protein [Scytonema sp. HK-05]
MDNLPLLELFTRLRQAGLPLGVDDYLAVLKALQAGYGISNKNALARLCRTLWVKSKQDKQLFEYHFEKIILSQNEPINSSIMMTSPPSISGKSLKNNPQKKGHKSFLISNYLKLLQHYVIPVVIFSLFFVVAIKIWPSNHVLLQKEEPSYPIYVVNNMQRTVIPLRFIFFIFFVTFAVAYAISRRVENSRDSKVKNPLHSEPENTIPDNTSQALENTSDEKKVLEAQQKTFQAKTVKALNRFIQITEEPALTRRQMKQSWRYLRRMLREGVPTELDVEATIERISRQGVLLEPVIVPRRVNRSKLLLFIDQDGSMMPFQNLSHQLAETAIRGGRLENTDIYYFHNCPNGYLYRDRYYQMPKTIDDVLNSLRFPHTSALVFSDAGAARGGLNPERVEVTAQFLEQLREQVRHIAWLNPMPRYRWLGTTAGQIARLVPMFELSRQGFHNAISVLRGQSGHFGVSKL